MALSRPFITGEVNVSAVRFTPDGKSISFLARRGKDTTRSLYVMPLDGGEARRVLAHETDITGYAWSPDGARVAFTAREALPKERRDLEKKGFNQEIYEESGAARARVGGCLARTIAARAARPAGVGVGAPRGARSDNRLALALAPTSLIDDDYMARRVHVVDADSGRIVTHLGQQGQARHPSWSPDGRTLALISGEDINDPAARPAARRRPRRAGALKDMLPDYQGHVAAIAWKDADTHRVHRRRGRRNRARAR